MKRRKEIETAARVEYPREIRWTDMGDEDWNLPGYNAFIVGAEWADKTMIDKACDLYRKELQQMQKLLSMIRKTAAGLLDIEGSVESFRKAMEE